ncbi:MAG: hypothetical protein GEV03_10855 [Streptosporangiales bacterium]|nr:hypothetical protein [Streptosporangiales bacterium]
MARSTHKSCPLAFAADTGVLVLRGEGTSQVVVTPACYAVMRPNQELSNRLIRRWHPTDRYLKSQARVHLNVGAHLDGERLLWWRTTRTGASVRESLTALRLPKPAHEIIDQATDGMPTGQLWEELSEPDREVLLQLVQQGILAREDLVTPLDGNPWPKLDTAAAAADHEQISPSEIGSYRKVERTARRFSIPQPVEPAQIQNVTAALAGLRDLSDQVVGPDRIPSSGASVDTYRHVQGDLSRHDRETVRRAVAQYFTLGGLAYPSTPTCRNRQRFIEHFRATYGDDTPVHVEGLLINDWQVIDRALSFLLSPDHSPVHPDNDLVWPEPQSTHGPYAALYGQLDAAAASGKRRYHVEPLDLQPPILRKARPLIDAICRLARSGDGRLDVFVESATVSGRLVERHLEALRRLGPSAAEAVDRHLRSRHGSAPSEYRHGERTLIVASHSIPRLQNLCHLMRAGEPVLAITEPVPADADGSLLRYSELYVRFDSSCQGFALTRGPDGVPLDFEWPTPLSPSFSRRLHFLRFLALATAPVITAPRWLAFEATTGGHLPRIHVGPLVISPERWSVPISRFDACLTAASRTGRYLALSALQDEIGLPDELFVYTSHDTRPAFVDLASPWGADTLFHVLRKGARDASATALMEERFPQPGEEIVDSPSRSCSMIFQCSLNPASCEEPHAC